MFILSPVRSMSPLFEVTPPVATVSVLSSPFAVMSMVPPSVVLDPVTLTLSTSMTLTFPEVVLVKSRVVTAVWIAFPSPMPPPAVSVATLAEISPFASPSSIEPPATSVMSPVPASRSIAVRPLASSMNWSPFAPEESVVKSPTEISREFAPVPIPAGAVTLRMSVVTAVKPFATCVTVPPSASVARSFSVSAVNSTV